MATSLAARAGAAYSILLAIGAQAARAQDEPTEPAPVSPEELKEIEGALGADRAAAAEDAKPASEPARAGAGGSLNPDLAVVVGSAVAWFTEDDPLQGGGHDPAANGFTLQYVELAISKAVDPYFRFDGFIAFSQEGVEVEEAYATTLSLPASLQLRAGQFLTRFGRINATHPHAWDFVDQPFSHTRVFGGEGDRGVGVELSWLTPLPWYVELVASASEAGARSFFGEPAESEEPELERDVDDLLDLQYTVAAKQFFELSSDWSLLAGLSWATGPNPTGPDHRSDVFGIDLYLKYRPITEGSHTSVALQTEWMLRRRQVPGDVLQDVNGYAQLAWRFARRWSTAARWEHGEPAEDVDGTGAIDDLDPEWTDPRDRFSASLTLHPTEYSRVRLQGSADLIGWRDDPVMAFFVAFEVGVGAHGAHAF